MKLGIFIPLEFFSPREAVACARAAEEAGLDHVVVNDHLQLPWTPCLSEAWTTLAAMASATSSVRLGPCVTPLPLRHPFLVAKMAATVDLLSEGRLFVGVGAGWNPGEFACLEVPFRVHRRRLDQTEEAIRLLLALWREGEVTFRGRYYRVEGVALEPKPVRHPHPPLLLGGGSLRVLEMAAEYGSGWMPFAPSLRGMEERLARLERMLEERGRSLRGFQVIPSFILQLGEDRGEAERSLPAPLRARMEAERRWILGSPEECTDRIRSYGRAGATHMSLRLVDPDRAVEHVKVIADRIAPKV